VIISLTVVINGPLATAGSILSAFIPKGITAPKVVDTIKAIKIDEAVTVA
jgi:hypothetical protein